MLDRFFGNKKYVFRKKLLFENIGPLTSPWTTGATWADEIDGKPVKVQDMHNGICIAKGFSGENIPFSVSPEWCEEV